MPTENDVLSKWIAERLPEGHLFRGKDFKILHWLAAADDGIWIEQQVATGLLLDAMAAASSCIFMYRPTSETHWAVAAGNQSMTNNGPTRYLAARAACEAVMGQKQG